MVSTVNSPQFRVVSSKTISPSSLNLPTQSIGWFQILSTLACSHIIVLFLPWWCRPTCIYKIAQVKCSQWHVFNWSSHKQYYYMYIDHPNICKNMATSAMLLYPNLVKPPFSYINIYVKFHCIMQYWFHIFKSHRPWSGTVKYSVSSLLCGW